VKFHIEKLKLKYDILQKHILTCNQRLDEINKQTSIDLQNENQIQKYKEKFFIFYSFSFSIEIKNNKKNQIMK